MAVEACANTDERPLEAPVRIEYHMHADTKLVTSSAPCTRWPGREQHFYLNRAFPQCFLNLCARKSPRQRISLVTIFSLAFSASSEVGSLPTHQNSQPPNLPKGVHLERWTWISRNPLTSTPSSIGPMIRVPCMLWPRMGERFFFSG